MNKKEHMEDIIFYMEKYHYENICLEDDEAKFIHDYIINLHSKIDKAKEHIKNINNKKIIDLNWELEELLEILGKEK